jgi:large repetitive protein
VHLTLGVDQIRTDLNFIEIGPAKIGDHAWFDLNADGTYDLDEPGLPGLAVTVTWAGFDGIVGTADDMIFTTITDRIGNWIIDNLPAGNYTIVYGRLPGGTQPTSPATLLTATVTSTTLTADLGITGTGEIHDSVWYDWNRDGTRQATDDGIAKVHVTVTWCGSDGVLGTDDDLVFTTTTDNHGDWRIDGLPDGCYNVSVDINGLPGANPVTADSVDALDGKATITLGAGAHRPTAAGIGIGRNTPLPVTGSDIGGLIELAALTTLLGFMLVLGTRRRRSHDRTTV